MSDHKTEGFKIVRRTRTNNKVGWVPDVVCAATQLTTNAWDSYASMLLLWGTEAVTMLATGIDPAGTDLGMLMWRYLNRGGPSLPCREGVGPDETEYVLDEHCEATDDGQGFTVRIEAYRPSSEDKLPGGTRLPMTEIDKLATHAGTFSFSVSILGMNPSFSADASGIFADDPKMAEVVKKLNSV